MSKVLLEKQGHVAVVTINRPEARNALDPETVVGLAACWVRIRDDDDIRVALVTGAGDLAFCAGADLKRLVPLYNGERQAQDEWDERLLADRSLIGTAMLRSFDVTKPVIAAVNGFAVGGGMELVMGTDLRIASTEARFGLQEVLWGLFPSGGSTVRLPRQIPCVRAMELMLTGDLIEARQAHELGFLNRIVAPGDVLAAASRLAEKIARRAPLSVRAIRRSVRACSGLPEEDALAVEQEIADGVFASQDAIEGARAFRERRAPVFKGV
ncbi:enoyl-CoA hydratase-related protein [Bosea sp. (in: a-proteobacteria)]|uniref:enoyl-CoA hydratase-related protein n=1 Tax=Bosea sp. (in: a-proteobacteria) TaxID=1871050 RepID=UPI00263412FE|nr:enoyl-CoA hydratase-related protein [Bosea sp. (in: a-proteobacteria)]MCO5090906.1 enoyl-CoA hydratase-related protein [Bosea sp. (in: a-proteobacteria)]